MSALHETQKIAAVVLFKDLHSKQMDVYDVLAAFIKEIIIDKGLSMFSAVDMSRYLVDEFGFDSIPQSVIKIGIKRTELTTKQDGHYTVNRESISSKTSDIGLSLEEEIAKNEDIINGVCSYIEDCEGKKLSESERDEVTKAFCTFLLDSKYETKYIAQITAYIVSLNGTPEQQRIDEITEGVYQYAALTYSDDISKIDKLKNEITVFLDTEALLSLGGFHGEIHKQYINELLMLISEINEKTKKRYITIKYMDYVKNEIDEVFNSAIYYVMGVNNYTKDAAESIADGCKSREDIAMRRNSFYTFLKSKGITEYSFTNRYSESNSKYNLEGDPELNVLLSEEISIKDIEKGAKRVSDIYKLREGCLYRNFEDIKYVFMSDNRKAQAVSNFYSEQKNCYAFVLSSSRLTNILWLKMNKGLSKLALPTSLKAMTRSRVVISSLASTKMKKEIEVVKAKIKTGELEKEALYEILTEFKDYAKHPEDVTKDSVDLNLKYIESDMKAYGEELSLYRNEAETAKIRSEKARYAFSQYASLVDKRGELQEEKEKTEKMLKAVCKKIKFGKIIYHIIQAVLIIICIAILCMLFQLCLDNDTNHWISDRAWIFETSITIIGIISIIVNGKKTNIALMTEGYAHRRLWALICKILNAAYADVDKYEFLINGIDAELLEIESEMDSYKAYADN